MLRYCYNAHSVTSSITKLHKHVYHKSLCIKCGKVSVVRTFICNGRHGQLSSERRHNENAVIMTTEAASAVWCETRK